MLEAARNVEPAGSRLHYVKGGRPNLSLKSADAEELLLSKLRALRPSALPKREDFAGQPSGAFEKAAKPHSDKLLNAVRAVLIQNDLGEVAAAVGELSMVTDLESLVRLNLLEQKVAIFQASQDKDLRNYFSDNFAVGLNNLERFIEGGKLNQEELQRALEVLKIAAGIAELSCIKETTHRVWGFVYASPLIAKSMFAPEKGDLDIAAYRKIITGAVSDLDPELTFLKVMSGLAEIEELKGKLPDEGQVLVGWIEKTVRRRYMGEILSPESKIRRHTVLPLFDLLGEKDFAEVRPILSSILTDIHQFWDELHALPEDIALALVEDRANKGKVAAGCVQRAQALLQKDSALNQNALERDLLSSVNGELELLKRMSVLISKLPPDSSNFFKAAIHFCGMLVFFDSNRGARKNLKARTEKAEDADKVLQMRAKSSSGSEPSAFILLGVALQNYALKAANQRVELASSAQSR